MRFGTFRGPIADVNLIDAQPWAIRVPRAARQLRLKEWQAFQFGNRGHFIAVALFNAKLLALAQVKVYDAQRLTKAVFEKKLPGWALRAPRNLLHSRMEWSELGSSIRFSNRLAQQRLEVELDLKESEHAPAISGSVVADTAGTEHQVVSIPFAENRGMYSHKGCFAVTGKLRVGGELIEFGRDDSYLFVDDHKGYYPRVMRWDWLVSGGVDARGRRIGVNLTRNDSIDPARYNENCVWVDGRLHLLPPVRFQRHPERAPELWQIRDEAGKVHVDFEVALPGPVLLDAIVIESRYNGPFGHLRGFVTSQEGERIPLDGMFGMGEDFYLKA